MAEAAAWRAAEIVKLRVVQAVGVGGRRWTCTCVYSVGIAPKATPAHATVGLSPFWKLDFQRSLRRFENDCSFGTCVVKPGTTLAAPRHCRLRLAKVQTHLGSGKAGFLVSVLIGSSVELRQ